MLYSEIHTKHRDTVREQIVEFMDAECGDSQVTNGLCNG